jgi:hypothetical protein
MWLTEARHFFFEAGSNEAESDKLFKERYCSERSLLNMIRNQITSNVLRKILNRLTELTPELVQSTPGWSCKNSNRLLVVFGNVHLQWRHRRGSQANEKFPVPVLRKPRFGLCGIEGKVYLWTDWKLIFDAEGKPTLEKFRHDEWLPWSNEGDGKCYFHLPLGDLEKTFAIEQRLLNLIDEINNKSGSPNFLLRESFAQNRAKLGVPEEFDVVYPKLMDTSDPKFSSLTEITQERAIELNISEPKKAADLSSSLIQTTLNTQPAAIQEQENDGSHVTTLPGVTGRFYVYALIDPRVNKPFYIGKGFHDRANQHFRAVDSSSDNFANDSVSNDKNDLAENLDHQKFGVLSSEILNLEQTEKANASLKDRKKLELISELLETGVSKNDIVRVIARGVSEDAAFAIEALLIKGVYGLDALSNEVHGKYAHRFRTVDDWSHVPGYDLNSDTHQQLLPDNGMHNSGKFYVYVLFDPEKSEIFYVGKGKGGRLCQHFSDAQRFQSGDLGVVRLSRLRELLTIHQPSAIGRIVARVDQEALAFIIESFYIKFVVGFSALANIQPGHLSGMFRSKGDWAPRHGFDLPTEVGGSRRILFDIFLGEGLDTLLMDVVSRISNEYLFDIGRPNIAGANELVVIAKMKNVSSAMTLRIQVRCARQIQVFLFAEGVKGSAWFRNKFGRIARYPLFRRDDDMFGPRCWFGTKGVTTDPKEAAKRAIRLIRLAQALESSQNFNEIDEFDDLLVGLPYS